jgi:hypothetical protein
MGPNMGRFEFILTKWTKESRLNMYAFPVRGTTGLSNALPSNLLLLRG